MIFGFSKCRYRYRSLLVHRYWYLPSQNNESGNTLPGATYYRYNGCELTQVIFGLLAQVRCDGMPLLISQNLTVCGLQNSSLTLTFFT